MPSDSPRASKRRRSSSSTRTLQSSSHDSHSPKNQDKTKSRAERLAGFDDTDELDQESVGREDELDGGENLEDQEEELCAICLVPISNKTVVYPCHHGQFCWNCIRAWTDQSRKCPLCLGPIEHLIHNIRSAKDYSTHYLLPLHTITGSASASTSNPLPPARNPRRPPSTSTLPRHALYGRARLLQNQTDSPSWREREEEIALERRKYVYREGLYAKHVASNRYTGFKPFTPQTFANNPEMKAKVIKFIRRELQVFPAVDISFLTTYLISISSQLDLRSSAALRLIADFLSEQDAQHLVHEITTFARSPFKSLESYDKFIQYGRPEREEPKDDEMEKLVIDEESLVESQPEGPRFAKNMYPDRRRRSSNTGPLPPQASMAPLPPKPSPEVRRRPPRSPSPPPLPSHQVPRRMPPGGGGGGRRREPEPDWRERDARYTGSYYRSSESRRDSGRRNSGRGRERRDSFRDDYRREFRERSRSRDRSRERQRSRSRSRSVGRRRDDRYSRSPSPLPQDRRRRYSNRSPSLSPRRSPSPRPKYRSPSPFESKSRQSRSPTPTHSRRTATPPPPSTTELPQAVDPEYEDAISLSAPPLSEYNPSPRPSSPQPQGASTMTRNAPKISIFGAARRLLGNGNIVTFSKEGGVELQVAGSATRSRDNGGSVSQGTSQKGDKGKGKDVEQEKRIFEEPYQPVPSPSKSTSSLLSRLGPASSSTQSPPIILSQPSDPTASDSLTSLKSKLQERLTAEYRQALSKLSSPSSTLSTNGTPKLPTTKDGKMDLRAVLQARLQAEKARAYDAQVARNASPMAISGSTEPYASSLDGQGRTVFSSATKELLLMRLEEERLLAQEQTSYHSIAALYTTVDPPRPSPPLPLAKPPSQPSSNEMDLKAKLLEKRKLAVEEELKKRSGELKEKLMREKLRKKMAKPSSTVGGGGTMGTNEVAEK